MATNENSWENPNFEKDPIVESWEKQEPANQDAENILNSSLSDIENAQINKAENQNEVAIPTAGTTENNNSSVATTGTGAIQSVNDLVKQHYGDDYQVYVEPKTNNVYVKRNNGQSFRLNNYDGSLNLGNGNVYNNGEELSQQEYLTRKYKGDERNRRWGMSADNVLYRGMELADRNGGNLTMSDLTALAGDDLSGYQRERGLLPTGIMNKRTRDAIVNDLMQMRGNRAKFASEFTGQINEAQSANGSNGSSAGQGANNFKTIENKDAEGNTVSSFDGKDMNELIGALKDMSLSTSPKNISSDKVNKLQEILSKYYKAIKSDKFSNGIQVDGRIGEQTTGALAGLIGTTLEEQLANNGITIDGKGMPHYHRPSLLEYLEDLPNNNDYIDFELEQKRIERDKRWQNFSNLGRLIGDMVKSNAGATVTDMGDKMDAQQQAFQQRYQDALKIYQAKQEQRRQEIVAERKRQEELAIRAAERAEAQSNWKSQFDFAKEQNQWQREQAEQQNAERNKQAWAQISNSNAWLNFQKEQMLKKNDLPSERNEQLYSAAMNQAAQEICKGLKSNIIVGTMHTVYDKNLGLYNVVAYTEEDLIADKMKQINGDTKLTKQLLDRTDELYKEVQKQNVPTTAQNTGDKSEAHSALEGM